jgi:hypothetical protein
MYGRIQSDPSIWMIEQFDQYRFASISATSQCRKGRDHPIIGCISLFVIAAFRATTVLSGCSNVTVFRIHLSTPRDTGEPPARERRGGDIQAPPSPELSTFRQTFAYPFQGRISAAMAIAPCSSQVLPEPSISAITTLKTSPGTGSLRRRGRLNDRVPHHGIRCRPPLVTGTPVLSAKSEAYSTHCIGWQFVLEEDGNVCGSPIDGGLPPRPRTRQAAAPPRRRLTAIDGAQTCLTRSIPKLLSGFTIRLASLLAIRVEPSLR